MSLIRKGLQRASGGKKKGGKKGETKEEKDPCSASRTVEGGIDAPDLPADNKQGASGNKELDGPESLPTATEPDPVEQSTSSTSPGNEAHAAHLGVVGTQGTSGNPSSSTRDDNISSTGREAEADETGNTTVGNGADAAHLGVGCIQETSGNTSTSTSDNMLSTGREVGDETGVTLQNVVNNPGLMDELGRRLDYQSVITTYWTHLAHALDVPPGVSKTFEKHYVDISPTLMLFQYLKATQPRLNVRDLKAALKKDYRNDIVKSLEQSCQDETEFVAEKVTQNAQMLNKIALELDTKIRTIGNWRSLAARLGLPTNIIDHFENYSSQNPTAKLFDYVSWFQEGLKVQTLKEHLRSMGRKNASEFLTETGLRDDDLVEKVILRDTDESTKLEEMLNQSIPGTGNWRNLACKLNVPKGEYDKWDPASNKARYSPTKLLLQWLLKYKPDLRLEDLAEALRKIERNDVVQILQKYSQNTSTTSRPGRDVSDGTMASSLRSSATPPQEAAT